MPGHENDEIAQHISEDGQILYPENILYFFFSTEVAGYNGGGPPLDALEPIREALAEMFTYRLDVGLEEIGESIGDDELLDIYVCSESTRELISDIQDEILHGDFALSDLNQMSPFLRRVTQWIKDRPIISGYSSSGGYSYEDDDTEECRAVYENIEQELLAG